MIKSSNHFQLTTFKRTNFELGGTVSLTRIGKRGHTLDFYFSFFVWTIRICLYG